MGVGGAGGVTEVVVGVVTVVVGVVTVAGVRVQVAAAVGCSLREICEMSADIFLQGVIPCTLSESDNFL